MRRFRVAPIDLQLMALCSLDQRFEMADEMESALRPFDLKFAVALGNCMSVASHMQEFGEGHFMYQEHCRELPKLLQIADSVWPGSRDFNAINDAWPGDRR